MLYSCLDRDFLNNSLLRCPSCAWRGLGWDSVVKADDLVRCPVCLEPVEYDEVAPDWIVAVL